MIDFTALGIVITIAGLFFWNRSEGRSDFRFVQDMLVAMRQTRDEDTKRTNDLLKAISDEIEDFHGKLCAIEERNKEKS